MKSLATKYRPQDFNEVLGQEVTLRILEQQLQTNNIKNCYLFIGPSGCGKTTLARIFANKLNKGDGMPIEIDAASNNGVDYARSITEDSQSRSPNSTYKVYILDECHSFTIQSWQVFLKTLEEPSEYSIFIFCTTNVEKVPEMIRNRVMELYLSKVDSELIYQRLVEICEKEHFEDYKKGCDYIAKICNGSVRLAISYLDKVSDYSNVISLDNAIEVLGNVSPSVYFDLLSAIFNNDEESMLGIFDYIRNSGKNIKNFVNDLTDLVLDLIKYIYFRDILITSIPLSLQGRVDKLIENKNCLAISHYILDSLFSLKASIKYDTNVFTTIEGAFIKLNKEVNEQWK